MELSSQPYFAEAFHAGTLAEIRTEQMGTGRDHDPFEIVAVANHNERQYTVIIAAETVRYCTPTPQALHALRQAIKYGVY